MALVQMKSAALLVREECLDFEPLAVVPAGFFRRAQIRNQMDGLLAVAPPPRESENGSVLAPSEQRIGYLEEISGTDMSEHIVEAKLLTLPAQLGALARTEDIPPLAFVDQGLEINAIELTVSEQHDLSPLGNQLLHLGHQFDVKVLREVALSSFGHCPSDGQAPLLVDQADHERHATATDDTSIDYQHQREVRQAQKQRLGEREEESLGFHRVIAEPAVEPFDTAVDFRPLTTWTSGNFAGNSGKIRALAAHNPTDQTGQGVQSTGHMPSRFNREQCSRGVADGLKSFCCRSCQSPFSAVLAIYTDRFEPECPEKKDRLAGQQEKNRSLPSNENVSGSEKTEANAEHAGPFLQGGFEQVLVRGSPLSKRSISTDPGCTGSHWDAFR